MLKAYYCSINDALAFSENDGNYSSRLLQWLKTATNKKSKDESVAAETLLRKVTKYSPPLNIVENAFGKPQFDHSDMPFSLTHTDGFVACAVGERCGIDAERISNRLYKINQLLFTAEQDWAKNDLNRLAFLWTAKEAFCKFTGKGFAQIKKVEVQEMCHENNLLKAQCSADGEVCSAYCKLVGDVTLTVVSLTKPSFELLD